ncbi:MAG: hypothetical protein NTX76_03865 [Alphaproteobacteria bacterium]|nr:hypothetical protein [Alphaproteobacteria bacterium]
MIRIFILILLLSVRGNSYAASNYTEQDQIPLSLVPRLTIPFKVFREGLAAEFTPDEFDCDDTRTPNVRIQLTGKRVTRERLSLPKLSTEDFEIALKALQDDFVFQIVLSNDHETLTYGSDVFECPVSQEESFFHKLYSINQRYITSHKDALFFLDFVHEKICDSHPVFFKNRIIDLNERRQQTKTMLLRSFERPNSVSSHLDYCECAQCLAENQE